MSGFDKNKKYIFVEDRYFDSVKKTQGKITSIERSFAAKYKNKRVVVVNENMGLVDNKYYVNYQWCKEVE